MKTVVFLLTAHAADDERVWYHQVPALRERGCRIRVVAPRATHVSDPDISLYLSENFTRVQLVRYLGFLLVDISPDVVICDTPMALRSAQRYRNRQNSSCRVLYDVTEWYPSKKNLRNLVGIHKWFKNKILHLFGCWTSCCADGFIFGEHDKAVPFRKRFPKKPYEFTTYYPDLKYIQPKEPRDLDQEVRLFYSGNLTAEKGFPRVVETAVRLAYRNPALRVSLNVLSPDHYECEHPENLTLNVSPLLPFGQFCESASRNDIFLDLRDADTENNRCLPIKLFYYMAMGRPVIYSNLAAIRTGCPEIDRFGHLVKPDDVDAVVDFMEEYVYDRELYRRHCAQALQLAEQKYHWEAIEDDFVRFILQDEHH